MLAKLIVEGKEFDIEIQDPKLQELLTPKKKTGYERVGIKERYYYDNMMPYRIESAEDSCDLDDDSYKTANYYSSKEVAENNARADKLMRQLRRFAVEHRSNDFCWNINDSKYLIYYDHYYKQVSLCSGGQGHQVYGSIYFDTAEEARLAIKTFKDELIWYFTEYKDSL